MGTVFKAYDKELDRTVALKLVRPDLTADPAVMQRFKQELLLASKISHRNILRIHDLGEVRGIKFISMAYVEGQDLHSLLKKDRPLSVDRVVGIAHQLCEGLEAAHAAGVVHRDLKPQNILIDTAGIAYISDFGIAKSLEASAAMTRTGQLLGTPRYMSPEQCEMDTVDQRSDLYSLGVILYEMATGVVPFKSDSTTRLLYQHLKEKPKSPKLVNPDLPDYLVRIILRCLEKDPRARYQAAREIIADLEAQKVLSPSISRRIGLARVERRRLLPVAGMGLLLTLLALAAIPLRKLLISRRAATPAASTATANSPTLYVGVLPLHVLGDKSSLGYVAEGLQDALSAKLFQSKNLRIASSAAVQKLDPQESLQKMAQDLGVKLVIQGTLQGTERKIRVVMTLDDAVAGRQLWTKEFTGVPDDLLTLEDRIYSQVLAALALRPSSDDLARASLHPTENIAAYDFYLKGRVAMRSQQEVNNVEAAMRDYQQALDKDPTFALAYTGMADANLVMYQETKDPEWAQKALAAAQQAQALNDQLAEVHFALGRAYTATGRLAEAIAELQRALALAPNSDEGYRLLGDAYGASGRRAEEFQAYQKAIQINPYYWVNYNWLGNGYWKLGDYDKALAAYRHMTDLQPQNAFGYLNIGAVYFQQGKYDESIRWYQKALSIRPYYLTYNNLGTAYFYLKHYGEAVPMFEKAVQMNPKMESSTGNLADAYRWTGQKEKAAATYQKAIALALQDLQVNPRRGITLGHLAIYYAKLGEAAQAENFARRARSVDPNNVEIIYDTAVVAALAGHSEIALRALKEAMQKGLSSDDVKNDPEFDTLRNLPAYLELVKESKKVS